MQEIQRRRFVERADNASRQELQDAINLRPDLDVINGQLTATISDATLDGVPIEQDRVDHWNQTIASRIIILGKKRPNSSLHSVNVTAEAVKMTWTDSKP